MKELRIHGRGGQGSLVFAELLAVALFEENKYSFAFPVLAGGTRRGAPVAAMIRIDDKEVTLTDKVAAPDYIVVQDITIADVVDVYEGLKEGGCVIINSHDKEYRPDRKYTLEGRNDIKVCMIDANKIAMEAIGRPIVNTALLGAFARVTGAVSMESIEKTIKNRMDPDIADKNIKAARDAYDAIDV